VSPLVLYKFRAYSSDPDSTERKWVRQTIFEGKIRFAKVSELNDPFEGRPYLVPKHSDPVAQAKEIYANVLQDAYAEGLRGQAAEEQARFETVAMMNPAVPQEARQRALIEVINENFWVYCASATREPILMWSHYADGHRGLALHFDARLPPFDRYLFEVDYGEEYPEYPFPAAQTDVSTSEAARALLYTKAPGWRYEEEFRSIRVIEPGPGRDMGLTWDGQIATLSAPALVGVTLGAAMPGDVASELVREITDVRPSLEIWQARVKDREYGLNFHRIR
jgi:hypothetical protein